MKKKVPQSPEVSKALEAIKVDERVVGNASALTVHNEASAAVATEYIKTLKTLIDEAEAKQADLLAPFNEGIKRVKAEFTTFIEPLKTAREGLRERLKTYKLKELEQKAAEEKKVRDEEAARLAALEATKPRGKAAKQELEQQKAMVKAEADTKVMRLAPVGATRSTSAVAMIREEWTFEVEKPDEVPRQYLTPDEKLIKTAVKAGIRDIPGVRIFKQADLRVR